MAGLASVAKARREFERAAILLATVDSSATTDTAAFSGITTYDSISEADAALHRAFVHQAYDARLDLNGTNLRNADLTGANLRNAVLEESELFGANLTGADLSYANLCDLDLRNVQLHGTNLTGADLTGVDLAEARLIETNLAQANLTGARIFGISARDIQSDNTIQADLVISKPGHPEITLDNLEFACLFIHSQASASG